MDHARCGQAARLRPTRAVHAPWLRLSWRASQLPREVALGARETCLFVSLFVVLEVRPHAAAVRPGRKTRREEATARPSALLRPRPRRCRAGEGSSRAPAVCTYFPCSAYLVQIGLADSRGNGSARAPGGYIARAINAGDRCVRRVRACSACGGSCARAAVGTTHMRLRGGGCAGRVRIGQARYLSAQRGAESRRGCTAAGPGGGTPLDRPCAACL